MKSYKVQNKSKSKAKAIIAVIMAVSIVSVSVTSVKSSRLYRGFILGYTGISEGRSVCRWADRIYSGTSG